MNHTEMLEYVADFYGLAVQMKKTVEELQELVQALEKQQFEGEGGIYDEVADVYNMLDQLCYLTSSTQKVGDIAQAKMERTVQRIQQSDHRKHIMSRFATTV